MVKDYKPINITFQSARTDFNGLGWSTKGVTNCLMEDHPYTSNNRSFCIGHLNGQDGKINGPPKYWVENVELFVNTGKS
jgi:hypothetical protein